MRTLVVMRHAKSDWGTGQADFDRPLATRGRADAPVAGRWLRDHVDRPDLVLVSPSTRTRQTWQAVYSAAGYDCQVRYEPDIYLADAMDLLALLRSLDESARVVMMVGHNPGSEALVAYLAGDGHEKAFAQLHAKFPTSAVAVLQLRGPWTALDRGCGTLLDVAVPRAARTT